MNKQLLNYIFRLQKCKVVRCLEPHEACTADAIRSHSVQNAAVLELLQEHGHVIVPRLKLTPSQRPTLVFTRVGRNRATTFTGLCATHDCEIFKPIETNEIDLENPIHLFLLAYRAVLRELHATMEAAVRTQLAYQKKGALELIPLDTPTPEGMEAVGAIIQGIDTHDYKQRYDHALLNNELERIRHTTRILGGQTPTIAVNTLFQGAREERIALNVFPTSRGVVVVFSYHESEAEDASRFLNGLPPNDDPDLPAYLSRLIIEHCENFVLAPAFARKLTKRQRDNILDLSLATLYTRTAPHNVVITNLFHING